MTKFRLPHCFAAMLLATLATLTTLGSVDLAYAADSKAAGFLKDGQLRFDKKDYVGAIIQSKNALLADRNLVAAQVLLGKSLESMGDAAGAEVTLNDALTAGAVRSELVLSLAQAVVAQGKLKLLFDQPKFDLAGLPVQVQVQMHLLRASAYSDLGEAVNALKAVQAARSLDPVSPDTWVAEVPIRVKLRQFTQAREAVRRATAEAPTTAEAWYQHGSVLHLIGERGPAQLAYDQAIRLDSDHAGALLGRASILVDLNRLTDAALDLTQVKRLRPIEPKAAYLRALIAGKENKPEQVREALKEVTELLDRFPLEAILFRPQILLLNGIAHYGLNEPEKAKVYFAAFQKVQPDAPTAKMLAQIYIQGNSFDAAMEVLEKYLKAEPSDGEAMALLGSALMAKGQLARAASLMQQALQTKESPEFRTVLGLSLMQSGQTSSAITELETAMKNSPGKAQIATALVALYFRNGQPDKAAALAEKLAKEQPQNSGLHNMLGLVRTNTGDATGAGKAFAQAVSLDGNFSAPKLNLARLDIATRAYASAIGRLTEILAAEPKNADAMFEMAIVSQRRGLPTDTLNWLLKAHALSGARETRYGLALLDFYLKTGRPAPAFEVAREISSKAPYDVPVLMAYARAQLANQELVGAKSTLTSVTALADYNPPLQVQIALLQLEAKNLNGAIYSVDKALSKDPNFLPAMALMADLELRQGEPAKAAKRAREVIAKHPNQGLGYKLLGDAGLASGQNAEALKAYRKAQQVEPRMETVAKLIAMLPKQPGGHPTEQFARQWLKDNPKDAMVTHLLADHYAQQGDFAQARPNYERLVKLAPGDSAALVGLARVLLQLKDPGAVAVAEQAVAAAPTDVNALETWGWALLQNGQADRARVILLDAKMREPLNLEVRYHLATALKLTGNKTDARREIEAALRSSRPFASKAQAVALLKSLN